MDKILVMSAFTLLARVYCADNETSTVFGVNLISFNIGFNPQNQVNPENVIFVLYTRKYPKGYKLYINRVKNLQTSGFNSKNPTKIIIHGILNDHSASSIQGPKNSYLSVGEFNVIAVDWGEYAFFYLIAVSAARAIGHLTGEMISYLIDKGGLRMSDVHIIGHSLGAHIAGFVWEKLRAKPNRITGLDPAAPLYSDFPPSERLGAEDAHFVDIIHTSLPVLGITQNIGHVDFYPAGGKHQPKCPTDIIEEITGSCDHGQSYVYFSETIQNKFKYPAVKCPSLSKVLYGKCWGQETALMGEYAPYRNPRGIYYVDVGRPKTHHNFLQIFLV